MGTVEQNEQAIRWTRWTMFIFMFCGLPIGCLVFGTAPNMERTAAQVPLGSRLSQLDELAVGGWDSLSHVEQYREPQGTEKVIETWFGKYVVTDLGEFKSWRATDRDRDAFTGVVVLIYFSQVIPDQLNPSFAIHYFYVDGVLKKKIHAQLPG